MSTFSGQLSLGTARQTEPVMSVRPSVAEIISNHVSFELESIDRLYLNLYVPRLQSERQVASFCRYHLGKPYASSALLQPKTRQFVNSMEGFVACRQIPLVEFRKGQRKDDTAAQYLAGFTEPEGILFVGKAQEKTRVFRTEKRRGDNGAPYPWTVRSTAMVNHWYFYCIDRDFGPFFIKFGTSFPYPAKQQVKVTHSTISCSQPLAGENQRQRWTIVRPVSGQGCCV